MNLANPPADPRRLRVTNRAFQEVIMYNGKFDWKAWLYRAFREEYEVERVLQPLRELDKDQHAKK